ncbi:symmetrical bis(5'-nucleosyl)-tetraphosphatase [Alteromonadaceae bacterium M269]|nr:symmetrical bis(5'-nucleosyl)-tetraphosphatase [Alteromonadaceae bacterium M269]
MANYIVGDLQGCCTPLKALLEGVNFKVGEDKLWAVGDLIGRGPEPVETLELLMSLGESCGVVLGNHDLHFLAVVAGIKKDKPANMFTPLLEHDRLNDFVDWLRNKPLAAPINNDIVMVHAGLYPNWSMKKLLKNSRKVEKALQSDQWHNLLSIMYGNEPAHWNEVETREQKLRFIINACTRMRYVTQDNSLELDTKLPPDQAPTGLTPWFEKVNPRLKEKQRVIFGHWAALEGVTNDSQYVALDTGYVWGGKLSMLSLEYQKLFSTQI